MTIMGIQWLNYKETERANKMRENISLATLDETKRSNRVDEGIRQGSLDESIRSNKVKESISWSTLGENIRHNKQTETLEYYKIMELQRANKAKEQISVYSQDQKTFASIAPGYALTTSQTYQTLGDADKVFLQVVGGINTVGGSIKSLVPSLIKIGGKK